MDKRIREAQEICAQVAGTLLGIEDLLRRVLSMLPECRRSPQSVEIWTIKSRDKAASSSRA